MEDKRQATALFRYSLIREVADPDLSPRQRGARIRALAATDHAFDERRVEVTGPTLRRWLRAWRTGGFQALVPAIRRQPNRTPAEVLEAAEALKREDPRRTAAQVARALAEAGRGTVSERTIQRHFVRLGLDARPDGRPPTRPPAACHAPSTTSPSSPWSPPSPPNKAIVDQSAAKMAVVEVVDD